MSTKPVEVEVKFRFRDHGKLKERLRELGAKLVDVVDMVDVYLQHPCKNFAVTDEALRVRFYRSSLRHGENIELAYKGPRLEGWAKSRVELVVRVGDFEGILKVLNSIGFTEVARIVKHREFYELDNVEISLDRVEGLGDFVELEDRGAGAEGLRRVAEKLGLSEVVHETYLELYLKSRASHST
ncbi:class IV adenylate cyclase [Infirmifilum lucidum]|uniref:Class IV adenylate cyclase n=1 Tax=Infirmifilum lucidum TaxID=2776706 RepID=A0A7L9FFV6_9CREN|nr:class IV adenylate cyclase [Infirmifilum lucidum]QOJ78577.1 class IV adenylate cyclase [Infirmifilum lucidum]